MSDQPWKAQWISVSDLGMSIPNQWICFRRTVEISALSDTVLTRIAADSKYWLWINGKLAIHEGQLKRGPTPVDTYYDECDISPFLHVGENTICILLWYFGKEGFCHKSSGVAGLIFESQMGDAVMASDRSWKVRRHPGFGESCPPHPNLRLPESNIHFDARLDLPGWNLPGFDDSSWSDANELGLPPVHPWNHLVKRPVPMWRFGDLHPYLNDADFPRNDSWLGNTIICAKLPANQSICPSLRINAQAGLKISMYTDNYRGGSEYNLRIDYITKDGVQDFESPAYLTGHEVLYDLPLGVRVLDLKYRPTQFDTDVVGYFRCADEFLNTLWQKAAATMLLNMRDGIQDPDRERSQWWGDVVILIGMILHTCDARGHDAIRKAIYNLVDWQKPDGVLYSPVPAGNWFHELPDQMLAAIGRYGIWYYYRYTGDQETLAHAYPAVRRYLELWPIDSDGLVVRRTGGWDWGDWGDNKDMPVLINAWFHLALESAREMALLLCDEAIAVEYQSKMDALKTGFNRVFWTGTEYRSPEHKGKPDDRGQALAVVSGIAEEAFFPAITKILQAEYYASPYMEKYVLEALFMMGQPQLAIDRMKVRYAPMVESRFSTLWESWSLGDANAATAGGGSYNHGWAGGPLTLMAEYIAGIKAQAPGFTRFDLRPTLGLINSFACAVPTDAGLLIVQQEKSGDEFRLTISVPSGCTGVLHLPAYEPQPLKPGIHIFMASATAPASR